LGRSPAILLGREDRLRICDVGILPPPLTAADIKEPLPYGVIIAPNGGIASDSTRVYPRDVFVTEREFWNDLEWGGKDIFLMGIIQYQNISRVRYEMKFCAIFDSNSERFLMRGGKEYNFDEQID
jgi:hypothetical protein